MFVWHCSYEMHACEVGSEEGQQGLEIPWTGLITLIVPPTWRRRPDNKRLPHIQFTLQDVT